MKQPASYPELFSRLVEEQILGQTNTAFISGCLINMNSELSSLMDVGAPIAAAENLFARLLDARILGAQLLSVQNLASIMFGHDYQTSEVEFVERGEGHELGSVFRAFGSADARKISGQELKDWIYTAESDVHRVLYDLRPVDWDRFGAGKNELSSLRLLSNCTVTVAGRETTLRPVTFLDDVHQLRRDQRSLLHRMLAQRSARGIWLAERTEVLNAAEALSFDDNSILIAGEQGRDFNLVDLTVHPKAGHSSYNKVLKSVAVRRPAADLELYADTTQSFLGLLDADTDVVMNRAQVAILGKLEILAADRRFSDWVKHLSDIRDKKSLNEARAGIALIEAYQRRKQQELFHDFNLPVADLQKRITSAEREAGSVALAREFGLPVYYGSETLLALANENVSQLLRVSADLFDQVLSAITRSDNEPNLSPAQQDRTIRRSGNEIWQEIPARLTNGRDVQAVVSGFARFARKLNEDRPISYAPGITGFALTMRDVNNLLDDSYRHRILGADRLLAALSVSIANNYLTKRDDVPRGADNERRMVFYLNRLLCPVFELPIGRGGYRTRKLEEVASWVNDTQRASTNSDAGQGELFDE